MDSRGRLTTLDAMRGIAAVLVVLYHCGEAHPVIGAPGGYLAVDFFFALSGFILTRTYAASLRSDLTLLRFTALRVIRLYPLFLAGLALGTCRAALQIVQRRPDRLTPSQLIVDIVFEVFMLSSPSGDGALFPLNIPAWSLFLELVMGTAFAAGLFKAGNAVLALVLAVCGVALIGLSVSMGDLDNGWDWKTWWVGVPRVGFGFTVGILMARLHRVSPRHSGWALLPAAILAGLLMVPVEGNGRMAFDIVFVLLAAPALVWFGACVNLPRAAARPGLFLGDQSYALYAIHQPLLMVGWAAMRAGVPNAVWIPAFIAFALACAWALSQRWDQPVRRRLSRLLHRPGAHRASAAVPTTPH